MVTRDPVVMVKGDIQRNGPGETATTPRDAEFDPPVSLHLWLRPGVDTSLSDEATIGTLSTRRVGRRTQRNTSDMNKAVVLLSGGLDSTTVLAIAQAEGFEPYALTFRYGQCHEAELAAARHVAARAGVAQHIVVDIAVPKDRALDDPMGGIPVTYVPARNTIFLSFALAWAETLGSADIFIGVNALDYSGYPDCRPEYIDAYQRMANLATKAGIEGHQRLTIHTPLLYLSKADIIRRGLALGVDYGRTVTCYDPSPAGEACGHCDACLLRLKGFAETGRPDPATYQLAPAL